MILSGGKLPEYRVSRWTRPFDLVLATVLVVVTAPLAILAGLYILAVSRGTLLLMQPRVGRDGQPFDLLKLRTMMDDAEGLDGPILAAIDDDRVIRGGRILRALHLDELPQLVNVLRGEMSLVGPRPERVEFVALLSDTLDDYPMRHVIRPGITGSAQVVGGYYMAPAVKLDHDLEYCADPSIRRYFLTLAATPRAIVRDIAAARGRIDSAEDPRSPTPLEPLYPSQRVEAESL